MSDPSTSVVDTSSGEPGREGPYARAAGLYRAAGWQGVLPVVGKKAALPREYTGRAGGWPDDARVQEWAARRGADNVCLRVPRDVLGVDVDAYDGRRGLETVEWLAEQVGEPLPPTWRCTSRTDGSGILLYRVPVGPEWVSDLGRDSDVQVVRHGHRYAVCWPSVHPDTGRTYRWYAPGTEPGRDQPAPEGTVPSVGELAALPAGWVRVFTRSGRLAGGEPAARPEGGWEEPRALDLDGRPVDVARLLRGGVPPGEQQTELFRYACHLRALRLGRDEALTLVMVAIQGFRNGNEQDPWTPQHGAEMVRRVWEEYAPGGGPAQLPPALADYAARVGAASADGGPPSADGGPGRGRTEVAEVPPRRANATDLGNSLRVARVLGDRLRYAADLGRWLVWDGLRWAPDELDRALHLTAEVVDDVRREALAAEAEGDRGARDEWNRWAHASEALTRRTAMLRGAQALPELALTSAELDADPWLLVVRNGTVDLRTGRLRPSERSDLCSRLAAVDHDAGAPYERWAAHVDLVCAGDRTLAAYLQRVVGYTLTGRVGERAFFFLEGTGSNGKNALVEPLIQVLGDYALTSSTALLTGGDEQHPTVLADLLGRRMVFVDETRQNRALNVERIKALTGSKRVKARFMRQDFFEFEARFKLWIAGNGRPTVKDPSDGVWRRMHRVQCLGKVAEGREVKDYGELLYAEEAPGILRWALEGLAGWRELGGLGVPQSVRDDVQEYRDDEDYEAQFAEETLERTGSKDDALRGDAVYAAYRTWAESNGLARADVRNNVHLGRALSRLGFVQERRYVDGRRARVVCGVRWQPGRAPWGVG